MKKLLGAMLPLLLIAALLSGCSKPLPEKTSNDASKLFLTPQYDWGNVHDETIVVWGDATDLNRSYMKKAFERYEAMTGNYLELVPISKEDLNTKVPMAFNTEGAEKPDIFIGHGGTNLDNLKPEENFYDFTTAPWVNDLTDVAINQTIYNGKVMGLPHGEASISGTLYNKNLFQQYNVKVPTNQKEFLEACDKFLKNGVTPVYLPYKEITMLLYQFPMDSIVKDEATLEALNNGELNYANMPSMKKTVEWYKTMSDAGYFGEDYIENDWAGMNTAMKSEEYAMMIAWDTWLYTDFDGDPSAFGLMPAFMGVPDKGSFEGPNVMMLMANKNSEVLNGALDLITFMADPYNYNVAFHGVYTAPVFSQQVDSMSTPQYAEAERLVESLFYDSTAVLRIKGFSQFDAQYIQKYMTDENYTLEACLEDMDKARIERKNEKYSY